MSNEPASRLCARCQVTKPLVEFPVKNAAKGWYRSYCRTCCREYGKQHYRMHLAGYVDKARVQAAIDRPRNRRIVADHLSTHSLCRLRRA